MLKKGKIHFFTGKGGVGKSTLSMAFAHSLAAQGLKTLWLEFSPSSQLGFYKDMTLGFEPTPMGKSLDLASWNGEDCLNEFVKHSVKLRLIYEAFYRSKAISALIQVAPALREIAFLGYVTSHLRNVKPSLAYDQIVIDAPSTGHFIAALKVPSALLQVSSFGPMGFHCKGILDVIKSPESTSIYAVFTPEPLVVNELKELQISLQDMGLQIDPWLNRAYGSELINEMNKINSRHDQEFSVLSEISEKIDIQQEIIESLKLKVSYFSEEASQVELQTKMDQIVKKLVLNE